MKAIIKIAAALLSSALLLTGCGGGTASSPKATQPATTAPEATLDPAKLANADPITITLTTGETIKAELYPDIAPITVANFEKLISENFYDGLIFHRVISGFMIQGGGYDANMNEKSADTIKGEFSVNGIENDLKHTRGVLSMARTPDMNSASSQFFIMHEDAPHLDGQYAAFGKVTEGMEVVDRIASVPTVKSGSMPDIPEEPIVIQTITLDK